MHTNSSSVTVVGPRYRAKRRRLLFSGRIVWGGLLRVIQRLTHYKHGDRLEFKLNFSVRDLLSDKGRVVRDQVEALVQAVQKAGSYQAREEAARAVHAVMDGMKDWVPADALAKLAESSPVREAARLGRSVSQRLQKGEPPTGNDQSSGDATGDASMAADESGRDASSSGEARSL